MLQNQMKNYLSLNELAEPNGIVIIGGTEDSRIPLCELKQAFALDSNLYNRSITDLSVTNASELYDTCVVPLRPECILLHLGDADLKFFQECPDDFKQKYQEFIQHIKESNTKCKLVIVSLKNYEDTESIAELNKYIKFIAESEQCEYVDISAKRVWNPRQTKDVISFVYSTGFVRPLNTKRPIYDLVKMLFCFTPASCD